MVRHVVLFKFRQDVRNEAMEKASRLLNGLKDKIEFIRSIETGKDVLGRDHSYDLALTITFDNLEDYKKYDTHPAHIEVKEFILSVRTSTVSVDYEF